MRRITLALVAAGALALIGGAGATDDGFWLYPISHGTGTIASWRAQQGEGDDQGSANQGLLLEKDALAGDNSAAAHVVGFEGLPVQVLSLAFEYRVEDGTCTATDPRWALFVQGRSGREYEISLGCKTVPASQGAESGWIRRSFSQAFIRAQVLRKGKEDALFGRIDGLALVFDRTVGHVYVDNILVQAKARVNRWTYAGDNGGTNPPGGMPGFSASQTALLAEPATADEQLTQDELFSSMTADEWTLVEEDAPPAS